MSERSPAVPKKTENEVHERRGESGTQLSTALAWDGFKRIEMKHHTPLEHRGATRRTRAPFYTVRVLFSDSAAEIAIKYTYNLKYLPVRTCLKYVSYSELKKNSQEVIALRLDNIILD